MGPFSQNVSFLKLQLFFLLSRPTYQVNSIFFSGSSNLQGSCYWWSIFFLLSNRYHEKSESFFFVFPCQILKQIPLTQLCSLSIKNMPRKLELNENYSIKIIAMIYLLPFCYGPRPWSKNVTKFSFIFASIYHIPEWIRFV